jgi:adenylosuccinate synthase
MTVILLAGMFFGDEGKGSATDALTRSFGASLVIRYNGGPQAAHHVVLPDGRSHCFSQFGSGTLAGASTFLSRFTAIEPFALVREAEHLAALGFAPRLTIDPDCPVVTVFHRALNRLRERARGEARHGSCGLGVGETFADLHYKRTALRAFELSAPPIAKLSEIQERTRAEALQISDPDDSEEWEILNDPAISAKLALRYSFLRLPVGSLPSLRSNASVIFEGAQGVLLDETFGLHPHTTWSTTTFRNADAILHESSYSGEVRRLGVLRAYATRHGAGPLPTEQTPYVSDEHNTTNPWQGVLRTGPLDLPLLSYAKAAIGVLDGLILTHVDTFQKTPALQQVCTSYSNIDLPAIDELDTDLSLQREMTDSLFSAGPVYEQRATLDELLATVRDRLNTPVTNVSRGPCFTDFMSTDTAMANAC